MRCFPSESRRLPASPRSLTAPGTAEVAKQAFYSWDSCLWRLSRGASAALCAVGSEAKRLCEETHRKYCGQCGQHNNKQQRGANPAVEELTSFSLLSEPGLQGAAMDRSELLLSIHGNVIKCVFFWMIDWMWIQRMNIKCVICSNAAKKKIKKNKNIFKRSFVL